jgi:hypothetical protein
MTEIAEIEIIELIESIDEDRVCTPWGLECDRKAAWLQKTKCCGAEMPLCNEHKSMLIVEMMWMLAMSDGVMQCRVCHGLMEGQVLEDFMTLTRI